MNVPIEILQAKADEQRKQLHRTVTELRASVQSTTEKFDVKRQVRQHFGVVAIAASVVALVTGYNFAGVFMRH
jgi:hypothetical protein